MENVRVILRLEHHASCTRPESFGHRCGSNSNGRVRVTTLVKLPELPGSERPAKRSSVAFLFERQQSTPSRVPALLHVTPLYPPAAPINIPHCHVVLFYLHQPVMSPIHSHRSATHRQPGGPPTQQLHLPCPRRANARPSPTNVGCTQPTPARDKAGLAY